MKHTHYSKLAGETLSHKHLSKKALKSYLEIDPIYVYSTSDDPEDAEIDVEGVIEATGLSFAEYESLLESMDD